MGQGHLDIERGAAMHDFTRKEFCVSVAALVASGLAACGTEADKGEEHTRSEASVDVEVKSGGETEVSVEHIDNRPCVSPERHSVRFASPVMEAEVSLTFRAKPGKDKAK
jgi:hypothetical protein